MENLTMQGLIDMGNIYLVRGNFPEAEKNFNEALRLAQLYKGRRSEARAQLSLASLRSQQGDVDAARDFFSAQCPFTTREVTARKSRKPTRFSVALRTVLVITVRHNKHLRNNFKSRCKSAIRSPSLWRTKGWARYFFIRSVFRMLYPTLTSTIG